VLFSVLLLSSLNLISLELSEVSVVSSILSVEGMDDDLVKGRGEGLCEGLYELDKELGKGLCEELDIGDVLIMVSVAVFGFQNNEHRFKCITTKAEKQRNRRLHFQISTLQRRNLFSFRLKVDDLEIQASSH